MSRSKHQTLKGIIHGKSKAEVKAMFEERDHDAMEWLKKQNMKKETLRERVTRKNSNKDDSGEPRDEEITSRDDD